MRKTIKVFEKFVVVEGAGDFPLDMLRYDTAFPATERDSDVAANHRHRRAVMLILRGVNNLGPTEARWSSYAWEVVGVFTGERYEAEMLRARRQIALEERRREAERASQEGT